MSDPFRQFFLDTVRKTITNQEPNEYSLLSLLQIVSPNLTIDDLLSYQPDERRKIFKSLVLRIHPDKHLSKNDSETSSDNNNRVTELFQNVQNFYKACDEYLEYTSVSSLARVPSSAIVNVNSSNSSNSKRRKRNANGSMTDQQQQQQNRFPKEFSIYSKWSHANIFHHSIFKPTKHNDHDDSNTPFSSLSSSSYDYPYPPQKNKINKHTLPIYQAYKCIHARGSITHGKPITKFYPWSDVESHSSTFSDTRSTIRTKRNTNMNDDDDSDHVVKKVFDQEFGGTKELYDVDDIKEELMTNGPVVSVSFTLMDAYYKQLGKDQFAFGKHNTTTTSSGSNDSNGDDGSCQHELLIVGWGMTPYGEAWKVQYLFDRPIDNDIGVKIEDVKNEKGQLQVVPPSMIHIGIGQFHIDDLCYAPQSNLQDISWQNGPYFDADFTDAPQWREWKEMDLPASESELVGLGKCFTNGLFSNETFVIRDRDIFAHSALYVIKNLRWDDNTKEWIITVSSSEQEQKV